MSAAQGNVLGGESYESDVDVLYMGRPRIVGAAALAAAEAGVADEQRLTQEAAAEVSSLPIF